MKISIWAALIYWLFTKTWFPLLKDTKLLATHLADIEVYRHENGVIGSNED